MVEFPNDITQERGMFVPQEIEFKDIPVYKMVRGELWRFLRSLHRDPNSTETNTLLGELEGNLDDLDSAGISTLFFQRTIIEAVAEEDERHGPETLF